MKIGIWLGAVMGICASVFVSTAGQAATLRFSIADGSVVGKQGLGALCFPKTPLRWERIYRPDPEELDEAVIEAFGALRAARIQGTVTQIRFDVCHPHWGPLARFVGDPKALKGSVELMVDWTVSAEAPCAGDPIRKSLTTSVQIPKGESGGMVALVRRAIEVNAEEAAKVTALDGGCVSTTALSKRR